MSRGRKPTTGRYDTREELERFARVFSQRQTTAEVARVCRVSEAVIRSILSRPPP